MRYTSILVALLLVPNFIVAQNLESEKREMLVEQLSKKGIKHAATLAAMKKVERHLFVPKEHTDAAYYNTPLPIGHGQTISQPYMVAYMTQILDPKPNHKVLEVGTGSGYQAAVLAEIVDTVYSIEIVPELAKGASEKFKNLGYINIKVVVADGYYGLEERAPFDAIIVTAAAKQIPKPLIEQLKKGGRMIIPIGFPSFVQTLTLVKKNRNGRVSTSNLMMVRFVPFTREVN